MFIRFDRGSRILIFRAWELWRTELLFMATARRKSLQDCIAMATTHKAFACGRPSTVSTLRQGTSGIGPWIGCDRCRVISNHLTVYNVCNWQSFVKQPKNQCQGRSYNKPEWPNRQPLASFVITTKLGFPLTSTLWQEFKNQWSFTTTSLIRFYDAVVRDRGRFIRCV
jgi:hypothetical protein